MVPPSALADVRGVPEAAPPATTSPTVRAATVAVVAVTALLPVAVADPLWSSAGGAGDWNRTVMLAPFDLALVGTVVVAVQGRLLTADLFRSRLAQVGVALYALALAVAFLAHPSPLGVALVARLAAGVALFAATGTALADRRTRSLVLGTLAGVGMAQALLGMAQTLHGEAFGIQPFDFAGSLYRFGSSHAGRGGLTHPYHLAVLLLVAQGAALLGLRHAARRGPWLAALLVIAAGMGITYTRACLLGQLALLVVALLARRAGPTRWAAGVIALGLLIGGVAFGDGWVARADATAGADPTSSRTERLREAGDVIRDEPLVGVGPGRYVTAQATRDRAELLPAHNLVVHEAAELGVMGAIGIVVLLAALARRCLRGGAWALMVALPMIAFLGLDAFPYVFPIGLALSAIWLALIRDAADATDLSVAG